MFRRLTLLLFLTFIGLTATMAQSFTPLQTDRPGFMSGPSTVGANRLQIEFGTAYYTQPVGTSVGQGHKPEVALRWSKGQRWELRANLFTDFFKAPNARMVPLWDLGFGGRYLWLDAAGVAASTQLELRPVFSGPNFALPFTLTQMLGYSPLDWLSIGATLNYSQQLDLQGDHNFNLVFNVAAQASPRVGVFVERFANFGQGFTADAFSISYWQGGATYRVADPWQLDMYVQYSDTQLFVIGGGATFMMPL